MFKLVAAAAAGYLFGTKAGRQRFEQIRSNLSRNPSVKGAVSRVQDTITSFLDRKTKAIEEPTRPDMAYLDDADGGPSALRPQ